MAQKEVEITEFIELREKKLYHQLTLKVQAYVKDPNVNKNVNLLNVYKKYVQPIENKFNPYALVEIISYAIPFFTEPTEALTFLESLESKFKDNVEALIFIKVLKGEVLLDEQKNQNDCLLLITELEKLLSDLDVMSPVQSRYYLFASNLYCAQSKHKEYYNYCLKYLGSTDLSTIDQAVKSKHAFLLGLAALLSESIYNFGELLMHPILETLKETPNSWLIELLNVFNTGDVHQFEKMKLKWAYIPDIAVQENNLRRKLSVICFVEMAYKRQATTKCLSFQEIADKTFVSPNEVELLVMKALAVGLVKGKIDQVGECVYISWVQPRVMTKEPIAYMINRLDSWCTEIERVHGRVLKEA